MPSEPYDMTVILPSSPPVAVGSSPFHPGKCSESSMYSRVAAVAGCTLQSSAHTSEVTTFRDSVALEMSVVQTRRLLPSAGLLEGTCWYCIALKGPRYTLAKAGAEL